MVAVCADFCVTAVLLHRCVGERSHVSGHGGGGKAATPRGKALDVAGRSRDAAEHVHGHRSLHVARRIDDSSVSTVHIGSKKMLTDRVRRENVNRLERCHRIVALRCAGENST